MKLEKAGRFLNAQNQVYLKALAEVKAGKKVTHWMWFIFPQLRGLGQSDTSIYYAIENLAEAADYLLHPVLGKNLVEISRALLAVEGKTANEIFGSPDDVKLRSSMTLFAQVKDADPVFNEVLIKYFAGLFDPLTLKLLEK